MSSILKALKKLEQQKSVRPRFEMDVASGIVREKSERKDRTWVVAAGMVGVALVAVLSTYLIMSRQRPLPSGEKHVAVQAAAPVAVQPLPAPVLPAPQDVTGMPVNPASALPSAAVPAVVPAPPPPSPQTTIRLPGQTPSSRLSQRAPAAPPSLQPAALPEDHGAPPHLPASAPVAKPEASASPGSPNIRLSGIAWQKDSASRLAVINGNAVTEGAMVDGARVEEIMPDRVKFSLGQRTFEVPLGKIQN